MQADTQHFLDTELANCSYSELAGQRSADPHCVLDCHATLTSRKVISRHSAPWRTGSVRMVKRELRQAERKWRSLDLRVYKELYSVKLNVYAVSVCKAKRQYCNYVICNCISSKQLHNVTNQLLGQARKTLYPITSPPVSCQVHFVSFQ